MATTLLESPPQFETVSDLLHRLGDIEPGRVLLRPPPGQATEQDVIERNLRENRLFELVEATLVEKAMGFRGSILGGAISDVLRRFVVPRNLGLVTGPDGMLRLFEGLIRIPDVAYISWERIPGGRVPDEPIPAIAPDLAVEVLSAGNTPREMERKRREYFQSGVRLIWIVDPEARTVTTFAPDGQSETLGQDRSLDGGEVLPGFSHPLGALFAELDRRGM